METSLSLRRRTFLTAAAAVAAGNVRAQERFPSKIVRIVVPFSAGGVGDTLARLIAAQLTTSLGQQTIVENPAGGDGIPGTAMVARAAPDGHTILQVTSAQIVNMALRDPLPYDLLRDFTPVVRAVYAPIVLLVGSSHKARTVAELVSYAKEQQGGASFGSGGVGSTSHLSGELFKRAAGLQAIHVPYKGMAGVFPDVIGGRIDFTFLSQPDALAQVSGGRMRALAVATSQRLDAFPGVPSMAELGYKGFEPSLSWGYLVPKATPEPIVRQLSDAIQTAVKTPAMQERLRSMGFVVDAGGPDAYGASIRAELKLWSQVIREAGIKPE